MKTILADEGREWKVELPESEYTADGKKSVSALARAIASLPVEIGRQMLIAIVGAWQNEVFFNKELREREGIAPKDRSRTRTCVFDGSGTVMLPSRVYQKKDENGKWRCFSLLNEMFGMKKGERVEEQVKVHAGNLAANFYYRASLGLLDSGIGLTTVFSAVHGV